MSVRKIDRYLAAEIIGPFLTALGFLFTLLFAMQLLRGIDVMFGSGVKAGDLLKIAADLAPNFVVTAIPVSFLFGVMLGVGRLSEDREVTALAASGVAPWRLLGAPIGLGLLAALLSIGINFGPGPNGLAALRQHVNELIKRNMAGDVKPGVFYNAINDMTLYAQGVSPRTHRFTNVLLADERDRANPLLLLARDGKVEPHGGDANLALALSDGEIHRSSTAGGDYAVVTFEKATLNIPVAGDLLRKNKFGARKEELTWGELGEIASSYEREGKLSDARAYKNAQSKRLAGPLATVVFAMCGVALSMGRRQRSRALSMLGTLLIYIGYYVVMRVGDQVTEKGALPPLVAAHLPNLVFLALGVVLLRRTAKAE